MLNITKRAIRTCIKNGAGFETLCTKFHCSREELEYAIRRLYRFDADNTIKEIQANEKKYQRHLANSMAKHKISVKPAIESPDMILDHVISQGICPDNLVTKSTQINALKTAESEISKLVMDLESRRKALLKQRRDHLKELHAIHNQLEDIRQRFIDTNQQYEAIVHKNNQLAIELDDLSQQKDAQTAKLDQIREDIAVLETVIVCVYQDGNIEPLEDNNFTLDDHGQEDIYYEILNHRSDLCSDLRLRDIKTLARIKAIVRNSSQRIELLFDDRNLENHFVQFV